MRRMKTLILCVDRDDDLGQKAGVQSPVVGRRRAVEAAMALGLADPEDSDTNALLAAVHLYDEELKTLGQGDQVEVACVVGHKALGVKADRKLAAELQQVLDSARPDEVILVSDGAEDEQILPILQSRVRVSHVHRSIVKQAPRLEGFYYVLTRILDDEKQAKRFVLPFAVVLLVWGIAYLLNLQNYAWGATLAFIGAWLLVHAMKWEGAVGRFFEDLGGGLRAGRLSLVAFFLMLGLLALGTMLSYQEMEDYPYEQFHPDYDGDPDTPLNGPIPNFDLMRGLVFTQAFLPFALTAFLCQIGGRLFDAWVRDRRAGVAHWTTAFVLIALGLMAGVGIDVALDYLQGIDPARTVTLGRAVRLLAGFFILVSGILISRYVRSFFRGERAVPERS